MGKQGRRTADEDRFYVPVAPVFLWYEIQVGGISLNGQQIANTGTYGKSKSFFYLYENSSLYHYHSPTIDRDIFSLHCAGGQRY